MPHGKPHFVLAKTPQQKRLQRAVVQRQTEKLRLEQQAQQEQRPRFRLRRSAPPSRERLGEQGPRELFTQQQVQDIQRFAGPEVDVSRARTPEERGFLERQQQERQQRLEGARERAAQEVRRPAGQQLQRFAFEPIGRVERAPDESLPEVSPEERRLLEKSQLLLTPEEAERRRQIEQRIGMSALDFMQREARREAAQSALGTEQPGLDITRADIAAELIPGIGVAPFAIRGGLRLGAAGTRLTREALEEGAQRAAPTIRRVVTEEAGGLRLPREFEGARMDQPVINALARQYPDLELARRWAVGDAGGGGSRKDLLNLVRSFQDAPELQARVRDTLRRQFGDEFDVFLGITRGRLRRSGHVGVSTSREIAERIARQTADAAGGTPSIHSFRVRTDDIIGVGNLGDSEVLVDASKLAPRRTAEEAGGLRPFPRRPEEPPRPRTAEPAVTRQQFLQAVRRGDYIPAEQTEGILETVSDSTFSRYARIRDAAIRQKVQRGEDLLPSEQQIADDLGLRPEPSRPRAEEPEAPAPVEQAETPPREADVVQPRPARVRLSIRQTKREGGGFLVTGRDVRNRQVRVFAKTLDEAKRAKENIRQGREAFPGTELEAATRAEQRAIRRFRSAAKSGDEGRIQRARLELEEAQANLNRIERQPPPTEPPGPPPKVTPGGESQPMPEFEAARNRLVSIVRGAARRGRAAIEAARARERTRRAGVIRGRIESALERDVSPLPGGRAAQRGTMPTGELQLADRLTPEEYAVLRTRIYRTLGPEHDQTALNIEQSLQDLVFEGKIPTESEQAWLEEIFGPELVEALQRFRTLGQKARRTAWEIWNLPRAIVANFDDSAVTRHGLYLMPEGSATKEAFKSHIRAIRKSGAEAVVDEVRNHPWFNHARAIGEVDFTLPSVARGLRGKEEPFLGAGIAKRIPLLGKGIEVSEQVFTAYINKLRIEAYAAHAEELTRMGAGMDAFKELGNTINVLSGRAKLPFGLEAASPFFNGLFFSARFNWARAQAPFLVLRQVPNLNTAVGRHMAKMIAKDVYGMWAGIIGMLSMAKLSGVAEVELDPRSSDFGKFQIGSVRLDPWGGQQQFARLLANVVTGQRKTTLTRQVVPADMGDTLARFIESKTHPSLGQLIAFQRGETFVGEELTARKYAEQWAPFFFKDIQEIAAAQPPGTASALGASAFMGVSVYNIPAPPAEVLNQLQSAVDQYNAIPTDTAELRPGQVSRTQFRSRNPQADAALFISGQVTSLQTEAAIVETLRIIQRHGLNPEHIRGVALHKERQERAAQAGNRLEPNEVDILLALLEQQGSASREQQAAPEPTPQPAQERPQFRLRREPAEAK